MSIREDELIVDLQAEIDALRREPERLEEPDDVLLQQHKDIGDHGEFCGCYFCNPIV